MRQISWLMVWLMTVAAGSVTAVAQEAPPAVPPSTTQHDAGEGWIIIHQRADAGSDETGEIQQAAGVADPDPMVKSPEAIEQDSAKVPVPEPSVLPQPTKPILPIPQAGNSSAAPKAAPRPAATAKSNAPIPQTSPRPTTSMRSATAGASGSGVTPYRQPYATPPRAPVAGTSPNVQPRWYPPQTGAGPSSYRNSSQNQYSYRGQSPDPQTEEEGDQGARRDGPTRREYRHSPERRGPLRRTGRR